MKSTKKFLCYSLALVGAALIFSAGCKKGDIIINTYGATIPTLSNPSPLHLSGTSIYTAGPISMSLANVLDVVANMGASSVTAVGFLISASGLTTTGGTTVTWSAGTPGSNVTTGGITVTAPSGTGALSGSFSSSLSTTASYAALSQCVTITWVVQSFATNNSGSAISAASTTITTVH